MKFFVDEYHDLDITQNLKAGQMRYHIENAVVLTKEIGYVLDNLEMAATADQIHVD